MGGPVMLPTAPGTQNPLGVTHATMKAAMSPQAFGVANNMP
jgi:hypothetical protein